MQDIKLILFTSSKKKIKIKFMKKLFLLAFTSILFLMPLSAKSKQVPISTPWKVFTDSVMITTPETVADVPADATTFSPAGFLPLHEKKAKWLFAELAIPSEFLNEPVYFETGRSSAALEIYLNGILAATHGTITPKLTVNHVSNTVVLIPDWAKKNGKVNIAIKCKTDLSDAHFEQFTFSNADRYYKVETLQNFLNSSMYYMMAAICLFLGFYFLFQLRSSNSGRAGFFFSLSLIAIAVYFFDMASNILLLPMNIQLAFSKYCLLLSISGLVLFINQFFHRNGKLLALITLPINIIFLALYIYSTKNSVFLDTLFTLSLAPVFTGIIYLIVILIKYARQKDKYAITLLIGIAFGLLFGVHDIIYQAMGKMPFAWLQGFSFFFINLSMFIVVTMETLSNKRSINAFAIKTSEQKEQLDDIMEKAKTLSIETINIANKLNESVSSVAQAADESATMANQIGSFITEQNTAVKNTSSAVSNLLDSVNIVRNEVENEGNIVKTTVDETNMMIEGVNQVAEGIENAANFSNSLGKLTLKSSKDIGNLVTLMENIKNSSEEIMAIVKVVSDFSRRTNMLAMNASIEAAHSGIAGKGFSVIAHEIKKLAEASNTQSEKINDIVTVIDENISASFELGKNIKVAMEDAAKEATTASAKVNESVTGMENQRLAGNRIKDATSLMTESASNVQEETKQQYSFAQEVSSNMNELSQSAEKAEAAVTDIISNNMELSQQTAMLRDLASRAKEAASELDKLING